MGGKVAFLGVFTALAMIASYIEAIIPFNFGVPGIKLGLANIVVLFALYVFGLKEAFAISVVRIVLVSFIFGSLSVMLYSLAGGILSFGVMAIFKKSKVFSIVGVSMLGAVFHNVGQLIVAMLVIENLNLIFYGPILLGIGVVTGLLIGIAAAETIKRIPRSFSKGEN